MEPPSPDFRKSYIEKQNRLIQKRRKAPESSLHGSSIFSYDISLNSLSFKSESDHKEVSFQNFSSRSKKPSEVFYECLNAKLSEKDERILRLMAARREAKIEEDELAFSAKNAWEAEKIQQTKETEEKKRILKESLAKKRQLRELEICFRKNDREEILKQEKLMLEMQISEKHEKAERRQKELLLQKRLKPDCLTTRYKLQLHREIRKEKEREEEMEKALHVQEFLAKENRSEEKFKCIKMERNRKLKEESLREELKQQAAKIIREELWRKSEEERIRHLRHSERNRMLRGERVIWAREWRRKLAREKNEREKRQHSLIYNKIKEEEIEKLNRERRRIQAKDARSRIFKEKREEAIMASKLNALALGNIRQKMRSTLDL